MNNVILHGIMQDDFKVNKVGDKMVAKGTLRVDKKLTNAKKDEMKANGHPTSDFPQIVIWGSEARINLLTSNVVKGDKFLVQGYIETGSYVKADGTKAYTTIVNVQDFDFNFKEKENFDDKEI